MSDLYSRIPSTIDTSDEIDEWVFNAFAGRTMNELIEGSSRSDFGLTSKNYMHYAAQSVQQQQDEREQLGATPMSAEEQVAITDAYRQLGGDQPLFYDVGPGGVAIQEENRFNAAYSKVIEGRSAISDIMNGINRTFVGRTTGLIGTVAPSYAAELEEQNQMLLKGRGGWSTFIGDIAGQALVSAGLAAGAGVAGLVWAAPGLFAAQTFGSTRTDVFKERLKGKDISLAKELGAATLNGAAEFIFEHFGGRMASGAAGQARKFIPAIGKQILDKGVKGTTGLLKTALREGGLDIAKYSVGGGLEEFFTQLAQNTITNLYRPQKIMEGAGKAFLAGMIQPLMIAGPAALNSQFIAPLRKTKAFTPQEQVEKLEQMRENVRGDESITDNNKEQMYEELDNRIVELQPDIEAQITEEAQPVVEEERVRLPGEELIPTPSTPTDKFVSEGAIIEPGKAEPPKPTERQQPYEPTPTTDDPQFKEPTIAAGITPQNYYSQILGTKYLTKPSEIGKQEMDLEFNEIRGQIDGMLRALDKEAKTPWGERRRYRRKGEPTAAHVKMAELLNNNEEAPSNLTEGEKVVFDYFRKLSKNLIERENQVRRNLGVDEIPYRTNYFRHVAGELAHEIVGEGAILPKELEYWMDKKVSAKIFNSMEIERQLGSKLEELFSRDLGAVTKGMAYTALKEIHLSEPLAFFKQEMELVKDVIPASTRKWAEGYINHVIRGQETDFDKSVNNLITQTNPGRTIYKILHPFAKDMSRRPMTNLGRQIGNLNITWAIWGRPKLVIRNMFQRLQMLALHPVKYVMKGQLRNKKNKHMNDIIDNSLFTKGYTGMEELNKSELGLLKKVGMLPYQFIAASNAKSAMRASYYDIMDLITNQKYADLKGWRDSNRTGKEKEGFLYPSEEKTLKEEMELAAQATQYQYIPLAMPGVFKHKTAVPLTRLQSWWMNHFMMFQREALVRGISGKTTTGRQLPWSRRVGWLRYVTIAGPILTTMGYGSSFLIGALPESLSPVASSVLALWKWLTADRDRERDRARREFERGMTSIIPGGLAAKDMNDWMTGKKGAENLLFYNTDKKEDAWWE